MPKDNDRGNFLKALGGLTATAVTASTAGCIEEAGELLEGDEGPGISNNRDRDDTSRPQDSLTPNPTASATPTETPTPTPTNTTSPTPTQEQNEQGLAGKDNYNETRLTEDEYQIAKNDGEFFDSGEHKTLDDFTENMLQDQAFQQAVDEASTVGETLQAAWSHANAQVRGERSLMIKTSRHLMENLHHLNPNLEFNYSNLVVTDHTAASGGLFDAALIMYQEENGEWQIENGIPGGNTSGSTTTPVNQSPYFNGERTQSSRLDRNAVETAANGSNWCKREEIDRESWALLGDQISDSIRFNDKDGYKVTPENSAGHEIINLLLNDQKNFVNFIRQANYDENFEGEGNYMINFEGGDSEYEISTKAQGGMNPFIPRAVGDMKKFASSVEKTYCS